MGAIPQEFLSERELLGTEARYRVAFMQRQLSRERYNASDQRLLAEFDLFETAPREGQLSIGAHFTRL